jgi:hypothetical protein
VPLKRECCDFFGVESDKTNPFHELRGGEDQNRGKVRPLTLTMTDVDETMLMQLVRSLRDAP